ncbi:MAG TPA: radical SAM protein [Candidatus Hydrogenedentes bacterium]|nr:radical SAM protein [Candidatus Hydrogenedentota bacterium]HOL76829.1 radical SAM protein [Candidatus Hydrogenedentota bacterium]HPO86229.1 radical SAM protein [Candidatus Hydrogenedentota bacterium]
MKSGKNGELPLKRDERYPLEWIDDYVKSIRPFVHVRRRDNLLIKIPNEAFKLNESGVQILLRLFSGEPIMTLWRSFGGDEVVQRDLYHFFIALKQALQGCLNEQAPPQGAVIQPFTLGFSALPILSEVALTYRCNLRCRFCYAGCGKGSASALPEMSTDEVKRVLRCIREDADVPSVSFTGGEPTLRDDLEHLVTFARRELQMHVNLITNGTRIDAQRAVALAEAGLNSAQVSLEAPCEEVHDRLTGVPGSFLRALECIRCLQEVGIRVHTNTTLTRANLEHASAMPAFVHSLGLSRFSMNLMIPAGVDRQDIALLSLRYREIGEHVLRIKKAAEQERVEFMWYSPTPVCLFNPVAYRLGNKGCAACDGLLSVSPTGGVLPCSSWHEPVGNLLEEPFEEVWQSARACMIRSKREAPRVCRTCDDFAVCQGACPLYWHEFGCEELVGLQEGLCHAVAGT